MTIKINIQKNSTVKLTNEEVPGIHFFFYPNFFDILNFRKF